MNITAAVQAIKHFNMGIDRNPYHPFHDEINHASYNSMMAYKRKTKVKK